jgi:PAS domain S-box-containing protein
MTNHEAELHKLINPDDELAFSDLFDASPDANLLVDRAGQIICSNARTFELFGYPPAILTGQAVDVLISKRFRELFSQAILKPGSLRQSAIPALELFGLRADGSEFPMQALIRPIRAPSGPIDLYVLRDMTIQKSAEAALQESEAIFRSIFDKAAIGIELIDLQGRLMDSNPALQRFLGYSADELKGRAFTDLTDQADVTVSQQQFSALLRGECEYYSLEKHYLQKDNRPVWAMLTVSSVCDAQGEIIYAIGMVEDIQPRKEVEAGMAEVQRRLLESAETERLGLAQELHDGPIQDLYGAIFQLQELVVGEQGRANQSVIVSALATIQQAISMLRYTIGELRPPTLAPFGLEKAIRSHAEQFHEQHPEVALILDLNNDGQALPEPTRLALFRIYQQLMSNVFRHAQASQAQVRFLLSPSEILLEVADDGCGFVLPQRWLDLARQGHLGLVGARERAEALGGRIEIVTQPGSGTRVTVIVPR